MECPGCEWVAGQRPEPFKRIAAKLSRLPFGRDSRPLSLDGMEGGQGTVQLLETRYTGDGKVRQQHSAAGCGCGSFDLGAMGAWVPRYYFTTPTSLEQEPRPAPRSLIENLTQLSLFSHDNTKASHHARSLSSFRASSLPPLLPSPPYPYQGSPVTPRLTLSADPLSSLRQLSHGRTRTDLGLRYLLLTTISDGEQLVPRQVTLDPPAEGPWTSKSSSFGRR
jgi:hypothetical protein